MADLARLTDLQHESLRKLFKPRADTNRSGPGFLTVAKLATALDVDLTALAQDTLRAGREHAAGEGEL